LKQQSVPLKKQAFGLKAVTQPTSETTLPTSDWDGHEYPIMVFSCAEAIIDRAMIKKQVLFILF